MKNGGREVAHVDIQGEKDIHGGNGCKGIKKGNRLKTRKGKINNNYRRRREKRRKQHTERKDDKSGN